MLRPVILNRIAAHERRSGVSLEYLRSIARASTRAFLRFTKVVSFASYRRRLPTAAHYVAALIGTLREDCGPCVRFVVNEALEAGVSEGVLEHVLRGQDAQMTPELQRVTALARAVVAGDDPALDANREAVVETFGDEGLVEIAFAIAGARVFPTVKRALGFAEACDVEAIVGEMSRTPARLA